ncbi:hypothetical protein GH5_05836 [Leishmania sp. Ghana 2012 LV757]|uniref:hypothetical protein n=1 Tax=Leishmania sp. Ghana 2012 LV757 TaxID=2803181 RepID=UPI001B5EAC01|nr:hypothetical protein GH5_05836 [Leishmania sp. Ghana 2012 LV757]
MSLPRWTSLRHLLSFRNHCAHLPSALSSTPLLALVVLLTVCMVGSPFAEVHAKDCITRKPSSMIAWKFKDGKFLCDNCIGVNMETVRSGAVRRCWTEYNQDHHATNSFVEEHRDGTKVVIHDENRSLSILLSSEVSGIRNEGEQNFRQLYSGTFISVVDCT